MSIGMELNVFKSCFSDLFSNCSIFVSYNIFLKIRPFYIYYIETNFSNYFTWIFMIKGTVSLISNDPQCKDIYALIKFESDFFLKNLYFHSQFLCERDLRILCLCEEILQKWILFYHIQIWTLPSLHGGSLQKTLTVPLISSITIFMQKHLFRNRIRI